MGLIGRVIPDRLARGVRRAGNRARDAGEWRVAAAHYRRYLRLRPDDFDIRVQLGHMLAEAGDAAGAETAYAAAAAIRPEDGDLLLCWGHLRRRIGDLAGARELYARSADVADDPRAFAALAETEPPARFAGRIERVYGLTVEGLVAARNGRAAPTVEFRVGERVVGHAEAGAARDAGGFGFRTTLDLDGPAKVTARRLPDGVALDGVPFDMGPPQHRSRRSAWDARAEIVKPFTMARDAEVALLVTHSRTGMLKPHVAAYLRALHDEGVAVLLVAVVDRPLLIGDEVLALAAGAMVRENAGYDFAAWAHAAKLHPEVYGASILYLLNDSVSAPAAGPAFPRLLARVRASDADLIGLTESHEYRWHLQSYFLALKPDLLSSQALQMFLGRVELLDDKDAVIQTYELRLAEDMVRDGFSAEALFPSETPLNPTLYAWRALVADGFPFMKLLPLGGAFPDVDVSGWQSVLDRAGFDVGLIEATIRESARIIPGDPDRRLVVRRRRLAALPDPAGRPPKIAFIGLWNYDNGLGSAARGIIGALRRTGFPLNLHPIRKPFHIHRPIAPAVDLIDFAGPADVAIVHLNPDSWHALTDEQRGIVAAARKRIGYWVWEMAHVPDDWWIEFGSVDRIWAPSRYCADLFAAQETVPVDVIPHAITLREPVPPAVAAAERQLALAELGIAADARVILYAFDGSSYLVRKNPHALVRAFAVAGLAAAGWTLVLKTKHLFDRPEEGRALAELAATAPGVLLVDRVLPGDALARLIAAADIYASPHCSEGFGLTIAEAMAAGRAVVATDFGGSTDFLDAGCGYPVTAHPWRLDRAHGAYPAGGEWARIDEDALAAALVRAAADVAAGGTRIGDAARARVAERLDPGAVGERIARSIRATLAQRRGRPVPPRRIAPSLAAGIPVERADLGAEVRVASLAADGRAPAAIAGADAGTGAAPGRDGWIAFAPAGSLLHPHFAGIVLDHARARPDAALFYADDLAVETGSAIDQARLKPSFDRTLLVADDYVGAPLIVRADALAALGGIRPEAGTAAVDDLLLRAHAAGLSIARITHILLVHPGPRPRAAIADRKAVLAASPVLAGHDIVDGRAPGTLAQRRRFSPTDPAWPMPHVTIVVPTRRSPAEDGDGSHVERLLVEIARVDWPMARLTVIVGDDVVGHPAWADEGAWPFELRRIETPRGSGEPFNYASKMNRLWRLAETEHMVFVNDDVLPRDAGWLRALMTFAMDRDVGGVGARLLYADGRLQHAGIAPHGPSAAHVWVNRRTVTGTYLEWARVQREWSMVTGAVFATRRSVMAEVDGFDETFSLEFNDTDLCLRMRALGYRIVCTPDAELVHVEKASRGERPPPGEELARFLARWRQWFDDDPSWHPRLRRDRVDMTPLLEDDAWYL